MLRYQILDADKNILRPLPALTKTAYGKRPCSVSQIKKTDLGGEKKKKLQLPKQHSLKKLCFSSEYSSFTISVYGWLFFKQLEAKQHPSWACFLPQTNYIHAHTNCPFISHLKWQQYERVKRINKLKSQISSGTGNKIFCSYLQQC